jgi:outer membrane protein OmpA-like peptidoglycan-associated protein
MGILPYGDQDRLLTGREEALIRNVFKNARLPPFSKIRIRNGLSPTGTAITFPNYQDGTYNISVGQRLFDGNLTDFQSDRETLVHEMTHVWQYYHGTLTRAHGITAHIHRNIAGKLGYPDDDYLYEYNILADSWDDMGFEGQAKLVEDWYHDNMKGEDDDKRFCFIKKILYDDNAAARKLNIVDLCEKDFLAPPGPDPQPIRVTTKDDSFVMILNGDVLFDFDKSDVKPAAVKVLDKAAKNINALWRNGTLVRINGYTDNIGSDDYNNRLSERRAQAVANWLSSHGVQKSAMKPSGFGKANPVAPNNDARGRAKNRRVEIFLTRP